MEKNLENGEETGMGHREKIGMERRMVRELKFSPFANPIFW